MNLRHIGSLLLTSALLLSCGKKDKDKCDGGSCGGPGGPMGGGGAAAIKPSVDLSGAAGLLVVDPSQNTSLAVVELHNRTVKEFGLIGAPLLDANSPEFFADNFKNADAGADQSKDGEKSLQKTDETTGEIKSVISNTTPSTDPHQFQEKMPKILTIAVSPKKQIFLHFERSFRHKDPTSTSSNNGGDPRTDGTYCQLFMVTGANGANATVDDLKKAAPSGENLKCLTYNHIIDGWQASRLSVFQFDDAGNVYFPGQIPNTPKTVVYKYAIDDGSLSEMINSNICVQDFLVTKSGGIFYTGQTSCGGGSGGGGGGFFRYVSSSSGGSLTEIARDWWNFIYEPISSATDDKAVFFGPDPTSSSTASWNSACLFKFDPAGGSTTAQRTSSVITCGGDIWSWIQMTRAKDIEDYGSGFDGNNEPTSAYKTEFKERCTSSGQVFAGGGSQISAIKQDSSGEIYVIGNVRKKNAGTLSCSVEVRGPHCTFTTGPKISDSYDTETECKAGGGTWVDEGDCTNIANGYEKKTATECFTASGTWGRKSTWYNKAEGDICTATGSVSNSDWWSSDNTKSFINATSATAHTAKFRLNRFECTPPSSNSGGDSWTSEYKGLAKVNSTTKTLSLLSSTNEQAIKLWVVNNTVYYTSFNSSEGKYLLRTIVNGAPETILSNFEVYNLADSGTTGKLYYDGLNFANNSYSFGTIETSSPYTRTETKGLTGTLKTMVILPKQ